MALYRPIIFPASSPNLLFITLKGQFQGMGQQVAEITRPGVDGYAMRLDGKRAKPFQMTGTVDTNTSQALMQTIRSLQGTVVSVQDDYQVLYDLLMVLDVEKVDERAIGTNVGGILAGAATSLLTVRFTFQDTKLTI